MPSVLGVWIFSGITHFSMTFLPPNIRSFPFFLVISLTDKPVGRSIHVSAAECFSQKTRKELSNSGYKIRKIYGGKIYSRSAPLARKHTNRIVESKDNTTNRGYYVAARGYECYLLVLKDKRPCNVLEKSWYFISNYIISMN